MDILALKRNLKMVLAAWPLGRRHAKTALKLSAIYQDLDKETARFRKASGMDCASGCGKCCENPYVEVSVAEMIPLAAVLWRRKRPELWIKKLQSLPQRGKCVFYQRTDKGKGQGRCRIYPLRPLICRLFGFAAKVNKYGVKQLLTCNVMKYTMVHQYIQTSYDINRGLPIPSVNDYRRRIMDADPRHGEDLRPLPDALRTAMSVIAYQIKPRVSVPAFLSRPFLAKLKFAKK